MAGLVNLGDLRSARLWLWEFYGLGLESSRLQGKGY